MERASLNISQWVWWVERDSILIAYYNASSDNFTSPDADGKKVTLFYIQRPDKFLLSGESPERTGWAEDDSYLGYALPSNLTMSDAGVMTQECEIPEQFHETLINRVIANGYERQAETIPLAKHFLDKYEFGLKQGRSYSYKGRDGTSVTIQGTDF